MSRIVGSAVRNTLRDVTRVRAQLASLLRPLGVAKQSATTKPELAKSSGEAGSPWCRAGGKNSAAATADAMPADEARLIVSINLTKTKLDDLSRCPMRNGNKSVVQRGSFIVTVRDFKLVSVHLGNG